MTAVLWTAIGIAFGAVILHAALALWQPLDRTALSFACIMIAVTAFLYLQLGAYAATDVHRVVEIKRCQVTIVSLSFACMFFFVPAYSSVRVPIPLALLAWLGLTFFLVFNCASPFGLWFAGPPTLVTSTLAGEPYTTVLAAPMTAPQLAYAVYFTTLLVTAVWCAVDMYRRRERERAITFAIALLVVLACALTDVIRDNVGGTWPYVAEYGIVAWGLIMSVQLARDFRAQTRSLSLAITQVEAQTKRLTAILGSLDVLEHDMRVPLDTLDREIAVLIRDAAVTSALVRRMDHALLHLRELAASMPATNGRRR